MSSTLDVAVIGMAARFPGARDLDEYWDLLRTGTDATRTVTKEELREAGTPEALSEDPDYVNVWSGITDADRFDAEFFGFSPRDAALLDPQHRVILECAWHALENAGYDSQRFDGDIAVYASSGLNTYLLNNLLPNEDLARSAGDFALATSNDKDNVSARISYKLDLTGPSATVQTNCSSSMVALHLAVNALLSHECDMALVGGVSVKNPLPSGYLHEAGGTSSRSGQCRSFDSGGDGYFLGDGAGMVVLRRREDAERARDNIYALVKGTATNSDGAAKVGYAAPGRSGQSTVIRRALDAADVSADSIHYVEANGTGTQMGDAIEVSALRDVFGLGPSDPPRCGIGSVKPNIGNLDAASGVAALIKVVLALHHKEIPPSIHFSDPNPQTGLGNGFFVNTELMPWTTTEGGRARRAGVSSFGVGGTNAHAILEEAPDRAPRDTPRPWQLLTVSARSRQALREACERIGDQLREADTGNLADTAYVTHVGRREFPVRAFAVAQAGKDLEFHEERRSDQGVSEALSTAWLFTASGEPSIGAGGLADTEPVYRERLREVAEEFGEAFGVDVLKPGFSEEGGVRRDAATLTAHLATGALLESWGLRPSACLGVGVGEISAAYAGGLLSMEEVLEALAQRWDVQPTVRSLARHRHEDPVPVLSATRGVRLTSEDFEGETLRERLGEDRPVHGLAVREVSEHARTIVEFGAGEAVEAVAAAVTEEALVGVPLLAADREGGQTRSLTHAIGTLWSLGAEIDWEGYHAHDRRGRVPVPGYPFQRERHWVSRPRPEDTAPGRGEAESANGAGSPSFGPGADASWTLIEQCVARVWQEQLGTEIRDGDASFLDLGGDSLSAAKVLRRLNESFSVELRLGDFLDAPTVSSQARLVSDLLTAHQEAARILESIEDEPEDAHTPGQEVGRS